MFKLTSIARHHSFGITSAKPWLLRSHPSRKITVICFHRITGRNVPYLTKHLHFPADLLAYVFCYSAGCFPALHQQLSGHLIALFFLLLSGSRVMSPRDGWSHLQLKTWGLFCCPEEPGSPEEFFSCYKFGFTSSEGILTSALNENQHFLSPKRYYSTRYYKGSASHA